MTQQEYFKFAEEFFAKALEISRAKNSDYTGASSDPFANFTSVESLHISTEAGFITRMNDKLMRIASFAKQGSLQVKDESVTDTLRDLANYCCLMAGYLASKKQPLLNIPDEGECLCLQNILSNGSQRSIFLGEGEVCGYHVHKGDKGEDEVTVTGRYANKGHVLRIPLSEFQDKFKLYA